MYDPVYVVCSALTIHDVIQCDAFVEWLNTHQNILPLVDIWYTDEDGQAVKVVTGSAPR